MGFYELRKKLLEKKLEKAKKEAERSIKRAKEESALLRKKQEIERNKLIAKQIKQKELDKLERLIKETKQLTPQQMAKRKALKKDLATAGKVVGKGVLTVFKSVNSWADKVAEQERKKRLREKQKSKKRRK